jgi:hypothetical protein
MSELSSPLITLAVLDVVHAKRITVVEKLEDDFLLWKLHLLGLCVL